jgi:amidase
MITRRDAIKLGAGAAAAASLKLPAQVSPSVPDLCFMPAREMAELIRTKKLSARELMEAHLRQISRVNQKVNAIVTLVPEDQLLAQAKAADEAVSRGDKLGPIHGLPVAVKDLVDTKGIRTTYGSPIFRDHIPDADGFVVQREKAAGAIVLGKTNVPEFGLGSHTFNKVFGPTHNPWDTTKTAGGSTGGGAVSLACGMAPLVDGSDMGGSLRNPGNFNNVVGIRPSPGRVPTPSELGWFTLSVSGPMARNVSDCAFFLSVLAGYDSRSPIAIEQPGAPFAQPLERNFKGTQIAMFKDMGLPWEPAVRDAVRSQAKIFESLGCIVEEAEPDLHEADECFLAWRHWAEEADGRELVEKHFDLVNDYVKWHVAEGGKLTGPYLSRIEEKRTRLYQQMRTFMERYEFFILPVNQVLPFDVTAKYPTEIAGVTMENYIAWMKSAYRISTVGNPAMSVPCAFSSTGLPIGIQIVGRHHDDWGVLQMGYAFEQATRLTEKRPPVAA